MDEPQSGLWVLYVSLCAVLDRWIKLIYDKRRRIISLLVIPVTLEIKS